MPACNKDSSWLMYFLQASNKIYKGRETVLLEVLFLQSIDLAIKVWIIPIEVCMGVLYSTVQNSSCALLSH